MCRWLISCIDSSTKWKGKKEKLLTVMIRTGKQKYLLMRRNLINIHAISDESEMFTAEFQETQELGDLNFEKKSERKLRTKLKVTQEMNLSSCFHGGEKSIRRAENRRRRSRRPRESKRTLAHSLFQPFIAPVCNSARGCLDFAVIGTELSTERDEIESEVGMRMQKMSKLFLVFNLWLIFVHGEETAAIRNLRMEMKLPTN